MKKRGLIFFVLSLLLVSFASAETLGSYEVNLNYHRLGLVDSLTLINYSRSEVVAPNYPNLVFGYGIQVFSSEDKLIFKSRFIPPFKDLPSVSSAVSTSYDVNFTVLVPASEGATEIDIFDKDTRLLILSIPLVVSPVYDMVLPSSENQKEDYAFLVYAVVIIFVLVIILVVGYYYYRKSGAFKIDDKVKDYVLTMVSRGFSDSQISYELKKTGYHENDVKRIFKALESYNLQKMRNEALKDKDVQLRRYVFDRLTSGASDDAILSDLKANGWSEATAGRVLRDVKFYFVPVKKKDDYVMISELSVPKPSSSKSSAAINIVERIKRQHKR